MPSVADCASPSDGTSSPCRLYDGANQLGYITSTGASNTYQFTVTMPQAHVTAALSDLPADYDLYLADSAGNVIGQSVQEGTTPELVDMTIGSGTYFLYVHSDPGRTVDPEDPYRLQLSMTPAPPTAQAAADGSTPDANPPPTARQAEPSGS